MVDSLEDIAKDYEQFVEERDWEQYHTPQNLAMAISIEANELLDEFLWFNNPSSAEVKEDEVVIDAVRDELADIVIYVLGLSNQLDTDVAEAVEEKMQKNQERFDEETSSEISEQLKKWQ